MERTPLVIGYSLEKALELLGNQEKVTIDSTITPYEDRKQERMGKEPIVVRQIAKDDEIKLTTSLFK